MAQDADASLDAQGSEDQRSEMMAALGQRAQVAARAVALAEPERKASAIDAMAGAIAAQEEAILDANAIDLANAQATEMASALQDRLRLTPERLAGIAHGLRAIAAQEDPIGVELAQWERPNGLRISRVRTPLGVIGVIYESRPNVTADAGALCVKAGNAVILRGGSDSFHSSRALHACLKEGLTMAGLPEHAIQIVPTTDRAAVGDLLSGLDGAIDVIVPRGGRGLVERVRDEARVPVFSHLDGVCHVYVHHAADLHMAREIVLNAKLRRTGICGAAETVLIDEAIAPKAVGLIAEALSEAGCEVRGDKASRALSDRIVPASEDDWSMEYLAPIIAMRVVGGINEAIDHIGAFGSAHTESIITADAKAADQFLREVDSAIVLHNASTQFADGGEFGMGAEIGIATGRMHARGPVGAAQLTTFKYVVRGAGQIRPA